MKTKSLMLAILLMSLSISAQNDSTEIAEYEAYSLKSFMEEFGPFDTSFFHATIDESYLIGIFAKSFEKGGYETFIKFAGRYKEVPVTYNSISDRITNPKKYYEETIENFKFDSCVRESIIFYDSTMRENYSFYKNGELIRSTQLTFIECKQFGGLMDWTKCYGIVQQKEFPEDSRDF